MNKAEPIYAVCSYIINHIQEFKQKVDVDNHTIVFNSLAPGKLEWNFRYVIFKQMLLIDGWGMSCEIALIWISMDFTDD